MISRACGNPDIIRTPDRSAESKKDFSVLKQKIYMYWGQYFKEVGTPQICIVRFDSLRLSQQLWSCRDNHFTYPHFFLGKLDLSGLPVLRAHTFACN